MKPEYEVADIIRHSEKYIKQSLGNSARTLMALSECRTAQLGGHQDRCSDNNCSYERISYNSCRNRHCPKCQQVQKEAWLMAMKHRTLPVGYFHVVFTIPHELNMLCLQFPKIMYDMLFKVAWNTLKKFGKNPQYGINMGMTAVLHTWGQNLSLHPHIHCIVPAGGLDSDNFWKPLKGNKANGRKGFLFPLDELKSVFKAKFLAAIRKQIKLGNLPRQESAFLDTVYKKEWVIYAKRPFGGADQVIEYLGRYTHKVAISNHRLIKVDQQKTTFSYKEYKDNAKQKTMVLENEEFLRRFSQHILPSGFTKIRHFGFHSGAAYLQIDTLMLELTGEIRPKFDRKLAIKNAKEKSSFTSELCPCCNKKTMKTILVWHAAKPPPTIFKNLLAEIEF